MITGKPLLSSEVIQKKVKELAQKITEDYSGKDLLAVCILRGAFMFFSDLVRQIRTPLTVDFIIASSYLKEDTTGEVKIHCDLREGIENRNILLVEDIVDTGITMNHIRERILSRRPKSLKICTLLDKREKRLVEVPIDYIGFEIPNEYVVGYGLDYDDRYRNLPYISIFRGRK
jgi:hypoxanthine phosphoribosyltransferase